MVFRRRGNAVFKENAVVVYLKIEYKELEQRLGDLTTRGVVLEEGTTLKDLYDLRTPLCEQYADIIIEEDGRKLYETVEMICNALIKIH